MLGAGRTEDLGVGQKKVSKMACPGKWKQEQNLRSISWWFNFDPYPFNPLPLKPDIGSQHAQRSDLCPSRRATDLYTLFSDLPGTSIYLSRNTVNGRILHHLRNSRMLIRLQIPTNHDFSWFQSGAGFRPATVPIETGRPAW